MPQKLSIEDAKKAAIERGGSCLSETYVNIRSKLMWRCAEGHEWSAEFFSIRSGRWCPKCGIIRRSEKARLGIDAAHKVAEARGGRCLSTIYVDSKSKLLWGCDKNHEWEASYNHVSRGRWCPTCANLHKANLLRTNTIDGARNLAEKRGGACLSETYTNSYTKLHWRCAKGHEWYAALNKIKDAGHWCPECPGWTREIKCRTLLEKLTGKRFPPASPEFLQGLRFDGYCPELGLAFEHNGKQHYEFVPFFHRTVADFESQRLRDQKKDEYSIDAMIAILVIPYWEKDLEVFIRKELGLLGITVVDEA